MSASALAFGRVYSTPDVRTSHRWEELSCQYPAQVQHWLTMASQKEDSPHDVAGLHQSDATAGTFCGAPEMLETVGNIRKWKKDLQQSVNIKRLVYFNKWHISNKLCNEPYLICLFPPAVSNRGLVQNHSRENAFELKERLFLSTRKSKVDSKSKMTWWMTQSVYHVLHATNIHVWKLSYPKLSLPSFLTGQPNLVVHLRQVLSNPEMLHLCL